MSIPAAEFTDHADTGEVGSSIFADWPVYQGFKWAQEAT